MSDMKIIFSIFGLNWNPTNFDDSINIENKVFWLKGDQIPNRKDRFYQESNWEFYIEQKEVFETEEIIEHFCQKVDPYLDLIEKTIKTNKLEAKVELIVEMKKDELPSIFFDHKMLELCSKLSASIDIDLYAI